MSAAITQTTDEGLHRIYWLMQARDLIRRIESMNQPSDFELLMAETIRNLLTLASERSTP